MNINNNSDRQPQPGLLQGFIFVLGQKKVNFLQDEPKPFHHRKNIKERAKVITTIFLLYNIIYLVI